MTEPRDDAGLDSDLEARLRAELDAIEPAGSVDPAGARRRARLRRTALLAGAAAALAVVVGIGAVLVPGWLGARGGQVLVAATPAGSPTPGQAEWRTEWYRDIEFAVPADWGYGFVPGPDWCAAGRTPADGPYVALGRNEITLSILCDPADPSMDTQGEHVAVRVPGPAEDYRAGTFRDGEWWTSVRLAGSVVIIAQSKDKALTERITASAKLATDPPCPARSEVSGFPPAVPREALSFDLRELSAIRSAAVCQYDPDEETEFGTVEGGLRAVRLLDATAAGELATTLASAPLQESTCLGARPDRSADIAVSVIFEASDGRHELWITAAGCPEGSGSIGGIEDGTAERELSREACRAILVEPIQLVAASGDIGRNCLG